MVYKKNPWLEEEPLIPEAYINQRYDDREAYFSWNIASPEHEFCRWVQDHAAQLSTEKNRINVLETGMGGGYITRRVLDVLGGFSCESFHYTGFEDMVELVEYVPEDVPICVKQGSPWAYEYRRADLVILDSAPKYRMEELRNMALHFKPGSTLFVHDAEKMRTALMNDIAKRCEKYLVPWAVTYKWLDNPRGGFMATF